MTHFQVMNAALVTFCSPNKLKFIGQNQVLSKQVRAAASDVISGCGQEQVEAIKGPRVSR